MNEQILKVGNVPTRTERVEQLFGGWLALIVGLILVNTNLFGAPIPFPNGTYMPDPVGIPAGLLFMAGGIVLLVRKNYTEINKKKGIVTAWHSAWDRRRVNRPLKAMEHVFIQAIPLQHEDDTTVYQVGLAWGHSSVVLDVVDNEEEAQATQAGILAFTGLDAPQG